MHSLIVNFVQAEQSGDFVDEDDQSGFDFDQSRLCALGRSSDNKSAVSWLSSLYMISIIMSLEGCEGVL